MTHLTTLAITLAGISWKPEIRGVLTVVIAVAILCGSVVLLLGTNMGTRLGFLVALTGLFGWMTILGGVWWMYGKGPLGEAPSWQVIEINTGDLSQAQLEEISSDPELSNWRELPASDPDRAEAQATVDAELTQSDNARFELTTDYVSIDGWSYGGKPLRTDDSLLGRVTWSITDAFRVDNPTHYAIAVKYDRSEMYAPMVVAKGVDHMAFKIRELAKEAKVPLVENPPLARALYKQCEIGDFVPRDLFQAVAEVLAYVYKSLQNLR